MPEEDILRDVDVRNAGKRQHCAKSFSLPVSHVRAFSYLQTYLMLNDRSIDFSGKILKCHFSVAFSHVLCFIFCEIIFFNFYKLPFGCFCTKRRLPKEDFLTLFFRFTYFLLF